MFKRQFTPPLSHDFGLGLNSEAYRDLRAPQAWGVFYVAKDGHKAAELGRPYTTTKDHERPRMTTDG